MSDKEREALSLRVISVSAHAALAKAADPAAAERIRDRADDLLAELEALVIRDGADEAIIAAIDSERRGLRE